MNQPTPLVSARAPALVAASVACKLGVEGIVSKRAGSRYRSGNSRHWLKSKIPEFLLE
jgi:ATP-dependent DNA ligase